MKSKFIFLLFFFTVVVIHAQRVKVINKITNEPIAGVAIYNLDKSKSTITSITGTAELDSFSSEEDIYFQHISHMLKVVNKSQIINGILFLESNTHGLNEIVISASKFGQQKRDIPQKIVNINSNQVLFSNPQTSADLLQTSGNVYIQKSQLGGGSPMIRGFSTNRLLITVDGVRMNNAIFRGGNIQNVISIDPFSVHNTEVILGAGSVIYGSDAIGGVMSFYTQTPKLSYIDSTRFKVNTILRYASASEEKTGHLDLNIGMKKWALLTNFSYSTFEDLRMGSHGADDYLRSEFAIVDDSEDITIQNENPLIQRQTGYNQFNIMQKVRYEPFDNLNFGLGIYYSTTSDVPRYDRLIYQENDNLKYAEWYYGPQNWFQTNFQVTKLSSNSNLYDKINATVAYQNFQESRISRIYQSIFRNKREEKVNAYSLNFDFEKKLSEKLKLYYGVEYIYNKIKSKGIEESINTGESLPTVSRYPNGSTWQSAAIYSSIKYKPNSKIVFQSGLRFNNVSYNASFKDNNMYLNLPFESTKGSSGALTGTAGISWSANNIMQWKLNASSAFRAPNIDDIGKVFDSEPGSIVVPNQNLKPEYAYGGELGLKLNFNDKFILDCSTYYTYLDNALVRRNYHINGETHIVYDGELSNVQAIQNASKTWIYGFETGLRINFSKQLQLNSQYSIIGGTEDYDGIELPVRHVSPSFGNSHLIWNNNKLKFDFYTIFNNELSFNQLAPSEIEKEYLYALDSNGNPYSPSWYTINFTTQYRVNDSTLITASLENITDQRYRPYSSGIAAPGRNLIVSLKYSL